jgi:hypothetical protein
MPVLTWYFYRREITTKWTAFADLSFSETKDDREFEYIDYFGNVITIGKKNRVFQMPLNFGVQFRLFENSIADNLRPFLCAAAGPTILVSTPYQEEFFNSFAYAQTDYAVGGYLGLGETLDWINPSLVIIAPNMLLFKNSYGRCRSLYGKKN